MLIYLFVLLPLQKPITRDWLDLVLAEILVVDAPIGVILWVLFMYKMGVG